MIKIHQNNHSIKWCLGSLGLKHTACRVDRYAPTKDVVPLLKRYAVNELWIHKQTNIETVQSPSTIYMLFCQNTFCCMFAIKIYYTQIASRTENKLQN